MFLDFYNLREQPFGVTPDPRYLYLSATHREALASLYYGIEAGRGFMALIAKPGMGKTTLLFQLLERLRASARTIFLFQTQCDLREFFRYLLADLGIDARALDLVEMHEQLNQVLIREARANRRLVLVIDEAQNLDNTVLESVRLLSDFETPSAKLMQIVLAGQPQLAEKLARPDLAQLRQRVSILARLEPLSAEEIDGYIDHRLQVAGHQGGALFKPEARALIAARSEGIPRNINNLCFNALSIGYALKKKTIDRSVIQEVVADLELDPLRPEGPAGSDPAPDPDPEPEPEPKAKPVRAASGGWVLRAAAIALLIALAGVIAMTLSFRKQLSALDDAPAKAGEAAPAAPSAVASSQTITVVVGPNDTLEQISQRNLGRFDSALVEEILKLNPGFRDPNRIVVGQRIRLPRGSRPDPADRGNQASSEAGATLRSFP